MTHTYRQGSKIPLEFLSRIRNGLIYFFISHHRVSDGSPRSHVPHATLSPLPLGHSLSPRLILPSDNTSQHTLHLAPPVHSLEIYSTRLCAASAHPTYGWNRGAPGGLSPTTINPATPAPQHIKRKILSPSNVSRYNLSKLLL